MSIHKIYRRDERPFAQIPVEAINDPTMNANAFRLLAHFMTHRDGYELTFGQIERQTGLGEYAIAQAIKTLKSKGWLEAKRQVLPNGQFGGYDFTILSPNATRDDSSLGDSSLEQPRHLNKITKIDKNNVKGRSTTFPESFAITESMFTWASEKGITFNLETQTEKFKNHHLSKNSKFVDWTAAWRKWMLNAKEWQKPEEVDPWAGKKRYGVGFDE